MGLLHETELADLQRMGIVDSGDPSYTVWRDRDDIRVAELTLNGTEGVLRKLDVD
jgi:hypothetical protein